jgi:hypothetical protein
MWRRKSQENRKTLQRRCLPILNVTDALLNSKRKKNMNKHIKSVHEEKHFWCDHCNLTFNRKDNLKRHLPVHMKENKQKPMPKETEEVFDEPCDER